VTRPRVTALAALERAAGKLDVILARDRKLELAPAGVGVVTYDVQVGPDAVKLVRKQAANLLSHYGATRLPSGEHQLRISYRTDQDLGNLMDDLLFEISGEAQLRDCFSKTEARLEGTDRRW